MYLPQSVPLSRPHVAMWLGKSGKRYDFAVSRARPLWLGQPVVYVLVRYDGDNAVPLFVGRATAADPQLGGPGSQAVAAWEQAMALGMTHLHLRFEACTEAHRVAEVEDLIAAIRPPLNETESAANAARKSEVPAESDMPARAVAVADVAVANVAVAMAPEAPNRATSHVPHSGGWLGRMGVALTARYRQWRLRAPAPSTDALVGRVTVRADAVAVANAGAKSGAPAREPAMPTEPPLTLATEIPAAAAPPAPAPVPAEPAEPAVSLEARVGDARAAVRQRLGLGDGDVAVLFAGEITWAAGADLLVEAMATVHADAGRCGCYWSATGSLRAELEARAWHGGFAHACRFLGDLPAEAFAEVFAACDAVVIPARTAQNASSPSTRSVPASRC